MKILATICARGGSKGVPGKNVRPLAGKPLIVHTIDTARKCRLIDRTIVSTDSPEIADIAQAAGAEVPFIRPPELAADTSPKLAAIKHAVRFLETQQAYRPDIVVDLDLTSPLRTVSDIEACIRLVSDEGADNVFSVIPAHRNPYFNMVEVVGGRVQLVKQLPSTLVRRQDAPPVYDMNASIYVWKTEALLGNESLFLERTRIYEMPEWARDIDGETDFKFAEFIIKEGYLDAEKFKRQG
jgi:CMP-N,N'-diacetyllegionaminic acid synthase